MLFFKPLILKILNNTLLNLVQFSDSELSLIQKLGYNFHKIILNYF